MREFLARQFAVGLVLMLCVVPHRTAQAQENLKPRVAVLANAPLFIYAWLETDHTSEGYTSYHLGAYRAGPADVFEGTRVIAVKRYVYGFDFDLFDHVVEEEILTADTLTLERNQAWGSTFTFKATLPETGVWDLTYYSGYGSSCGAAGPGYYVEANPCYWMGYLDADSTIDGKPAQMHSDDIWGGNATGRFTMNPEL